MQDDIVALFAYDRWANRKVLDACRQLEIDTPTLPTSPATSGSSAS